MMAPLGTEMVAFPYDADDGRGHGCCGGGSRGAKGGALRGGAPRVGILSGSRGFTVTARGRTRTTPGSLVTETPTDGTGAVTIDATLVSAAGEEDAKGEEEAEWEQWLAAEDTGRPMNVGALPW